MSQVCLGGCSEFRNSRLIGFKGADLNNSDVIVTSCDNTKLCFIII